MASIHSIPISFAAISKFLVSDGGDVDTLNEFIKKNGLKAATITKEYSDDVDEGKIIRTTPEAGTEIDENTKITAVVSQGSKPKTVEVPDLTGLTESDAKLQLEKAGLKYDVGDPIEVTDKRLVGVVAGQSINKGKNVNIGTTIRFYLGKQTEQKQELSEQEIRKNLVGKTVAQGQKYAEDNGLTFAQANEDPVKGSQAKIKSVTVNGKNVTVTVEETITKDDEDDSNNNASNKNNNQ